MAAYDEDRNQVYRSRSGLRRPSDGAHWRQAAMLYRQRQILSSGGRTAESLTPLRARSDSDEEPRARSRGVSEQSEQSDDEPRIYRWTVTSVPGLKIASPSCG